MSYSSEVLADSPRVYYRLNDPSGNPADSSGNGLTITTTEGPPTYSVPGAIPSDPTATALSFSGSGQSLERTDDALLDLGDVFTMEAWIKRGVTGAAAYGIVSKGTGTYYMRINNDALELLQSNTALIVTSTATITDTTTWHHVVCTKTGATVKQYIDGVDVTGTVSNATCGDNNNPLRIACDQDGAEKFNGSIDEVAVYPTALSGARVLAHYSAAYDFPTTGILDAFPGADEDPATTRWSVLLLNGDDRGLAQVSNQLTNASGGGTNFSSWYDLATFGPNSEVYVTVATASAVDVDQCKLFARVINPGTASMCGYELNIQKAAGADTWQIRRRDNTTATTLGTNMSQEIASGDSIGMEVIGTTISAYYKAAAGAWALVGSRTDSTYSAAGVLGIKLFNSVTQAWKLDDFGGGTIGGEPVLSDAPPMGISGRGAGW